MQSMRQLCFYADDGFLFVDYVGYNHKDVKRAGFVLVGAPDCSLLGLAVTSGCSTPPARSTHISTITRQLGSPDMGATFPEQNRAETQFIMAFAALSYKTKASCRVCGGRWHLPHNDCRLTNG